jgi:hypothetical protein
VQHSCCVVQPQLPLLLLRPCIWDALAQPPALLAAEGALVRCDGQAGQAAVAQLHLGLKNCAVGANVSALM